MPYLRDFNDKVSTIRAILRQGLSVRPRRGIVLLITVALLAMLTPLILVGLDQVQTALKVVEEEKFFAQRSVSLQDVVRALDEKSEAIESSEDLETLFAPLPPLTEGDVRVQVQISPLFDKVNLNNLFFHNKPDVHVSAFVERLAERYGVIDGSYLLALLLDTLDEDEEERAAFSEVRLKEKDFRNGIIANEEHLREILQVYHLQTGDENVFKIPWRKLVYFGPRDSRFMIDCERASEELLEVLGFEENADACVVGGENEARRSALMVQKFDKTFNYLITSDIILTQGEMEQHYVLSYDLKYNRVKHIKREWR